jgi:hypothetical protein
MTQANASSGEGLSAAALRVQLERWLTK